MWFYHLVPIISAIAFSIGALIDESQGGHNGTNYVFSRSCSRARLVLVLHWIIVGCILSVSYKAVLRTMFMKIEYEKPIDTVDDLLESEIKLYVAGDTPLKDFMEAKPTQKIRDLYTKKRIEYFNFGKKAPEWIHEG